VPATDKDPEAVLADALTLARDLEFRRKRRDFYAWRERVLTGNAPLKPAEAAEEMRQLLDDYNPPRCFMTSESTSVDRLTPWCQYSARREQQARLR
jgi:hypothetical protein